MSTTTRALALPRSVRESPPGIWPIVVELYRQRHQMPPPGPGTNRCYDRRLWIALPLIGRAWARTIAMVLATSRMDDVADGDRPAPQGVTAGQYLQQFTDCAGALATGAWLSTCDPLTEQLLLYYLGIGSDPNAGQYTRWCLEGWQKLTSQPPNTDPSNGIRCVTKLELIGLMRASSLASAVCLGVLGGNLESVLEFAEAVISCVVQLDGLTDLAANIRGGHIWVTEHQLCRDGVDPAPVARCQSFENLLAIPGFTDWVRSRSDKLCRQLHGVLELAPKDHADALPSSAINRWVLLTYLHHWANRKHRQVLDTLPNRPE